MRLAPLLLLVIACTEIPSDPYERAAACEEITDREMGPCKTEREERRAANPNAHWLLHCEAKTQTGRACELFLVDFRRESVVRMGIKK